MKRRTTPVAISEKASGIDKTVSSNGRIRGSTQRREFESHTIPFLFSFQNGFAIESDSLMNGVIFMLYVFIHCVNEVISKRVSKWINEKGYTLIDKFDFMGDGILVMTKDDYLDMINKSKFMWELMNHSWNVKLVVIEEEP